MLNADQGLMADFPIAFGMRPSAFVSDTARFFQH